MIDKQLMREMVDFHISTIENEQYWLSAYLIENGLEVGLDKNYKVDILKDGKVISCVPLYMFNKLDHREVIQVIENNKKGGEKQMTLLEKMCKELGVEVGEEWIGSDSFKYKIEGSFIFRKACGSEDWGFVEKDCYWKLLSGKLKPIWKPTYGETYFTPSISYHREPKLYNQYVNTSDEVDRWYLENNMVFKTKEEAIKATKKMLNTLKEEY